MLSIHEYLEFTWPEILVPGLSDWRRGAVTFGVVSFYGLVIVVGSFYIKKHIGQQTWRLIHFTSLGVFLAALIHGVGAGSDTSAPMMIGFYLGSSVVVAGLVALRLIGADEAGGTPHSGRTVGQQPKVTPGKDRLPWTVELPPG
jgi:predicted ferric reductase